METETKNKYVYFLENSMYINITNLCTNNCVFCIRSLNDSVGGVKLWLDNENVDPVQVISEIKRSIYSGVKEIVFCGYGEPLIRVETVKEIAKFIKETYPEYPIRVNTNGQASLIHKRNIVPELVGLIDKISVSLNAENTELYQEISCSKFDAELAYENVKKFIVECQKHGIDVTATIVTGFKHYKPDVKKCQEITESLGAKFRIREWLSSGYI